MRARERPTVGAVALWADGARRPGDQVNRRESACARRTATGGVWFCQRRDELGRYPLVDLRLAAVRTGHRAPARAADVLAAAGQYDAAALGAAEAQREVAHQAVLRELRARFVDGPVLVLPNGRNASFVTRGMTPLPGAGTITPGYHVAGDWGLLDAGQVLVSADRQSLTLPMPYTRSDNVLKGPGWTITLNPGWVVRPGARSGDVVVVRGQ